MTLTASELATEIRRLDVLGLDWTYELEQLTSLASQSEEQGKDAGRWQKNPPLGLLMSMAIREDHGLGMPGFYDQPMYSIGMSHQQRVDGAVRRMRQLYEEASGHGFYRPELEEHYAAMATPKEGA